ncbi:BadF/BadG/BcrA/BcrD ATPase family protein [Neptunicella marina]|uniref:ATPase n=1 Tax=Neptunicella marina TaxID=2125989 RepID=A0A8J6M3U9_9ALTE|nr:BadF/BadG/BcrA/BcrD ATPase family protein [Neptunicella marina]MBC3765651.1 ATPase [Neptunicella marina]
MRQPEYILGVDGGGTKTIGRMVHIASGRMWEQKSGPSSLTNDFSSAVSVIQTLVKQLCLQSQATVQQTAAVMGLAGGGSPERAASLQTALALSFDDLFICNDARTSLFGANKGQPIAMVALGTGSVGARLDADGQTSFFGGWGFAAGDEGGGAKLGLHAVKCALTEIDRYAQLRSRLARALGDKIGDNRKDILNWLSVATPTDYAQFSHLVFEYAGDCPVASNIVLIHSQQVEQLISTTLGDTQLSLVMLGGLAKPSQSFLSSQCLERLVEPLGTALDGACLLAEKRAEQRIDSGVTGNAS